MFVITLLVLLLFAWFICFCLLLFKPKPDTKCPSNKRFGSNGLQVCKGLLTSLLLLSSHSRRLDYFDIIGLIITAKTVFNGPRCSCSKTWSNDIFRSVR